MMSPTAPEVNKALIWHLYSAQAYGIFHGDLDFYFGGWDGRSRVGSINTKKCPVYMLTGEYDWSNTPEMSQATADKIPGAPHKVRRALDPSLRLRTLRSLCLIFWRLLSPFSVLRRPGWI